MQLMLAQTGQTLNLRRVMDEGQFLLANLGGVSAPETQRLIGALLVNGIYHAAKLRNSRRRRDWFLICDEFGQYATRDFANSLDELRKVGVHLVLAHQGEESGRIHCFLEADRGTMLRSTQNGKHQGADYDGDCSPVHRPAPPALALEEPASTA
jgi:hypothetical protein